MDKRLILSLLIVLSLVFVIGASGCGTSTYQTAPQALQSTTPAETTTPQVTPTETVSSPPSASATTRTVPAAVGAIPAQTIGIANYAFFPSSVTIKAGDTVKWENQDVVQHKVVADTGEFSSGPLAKTDFYFRTFLAAGTYTYHCGIHPSMTGTIIVQ